MSILDNEGHDPNGLGNRPTMPKATLAAGVGDDLFRASYKGECVTLSPALTLQEFHDEVEKLNRLVMEIATARAVRQANEQ